MEEGNVVPGDDRPTERREEALNRALEQLEIDVKAKNSDRNQQGQSSEEAEHTDETPAEDPDKDNPKRKKLKSWLNNMFRIKMTDGRVLIGIFVCTDADANIVMQVTSECPEIGGEERFLGLVMIPGRYIVSIEDRNDAGKFAW